MRYQIDPINILESILDWTEDEHDIPPDPYARLEWYARRLLTIRNAARSALENVHN